MKYFVFCFNIGFSTSDEKLYAQYKDDISIVQVSQDCEEFFYDLFSYFRRSIMNDFDEEDYDEDYNEEDYLQDYIANYCYYNYYEITEEEYKQAIAEGYSYI